jgi:putative ABC transport system ATP-binding protein
VEAEEFHIKMVELKNISKIYKLDGVEVVALKDVSLEIKEGEFVSIMGPSGSGKSTLLHIIGCLDTPTEGSYKLAGEEVSSLNEVQLAKIRNKNIGFIFQTYNLLPRTSALKNVEVPMIYSGIKRKERIIRAKESLKLVGLLDRMNHTPSQLSGGQQQRVAIARALVNNPKILLADEPTGNLDSKSGCEIMQILTELNKKGITIIMVTHDASIASYGKRIIELKDGEIIRDGYI